jgi:hypothetical protein
MPAGVIPAGRERRDWNYGDDEEAMKIMKIPSVTTALATAGLMLAACASQPPVPAPPPAPAATMQATVTDPSGTSCTALDAAGYCPGDDPAPVAAMTAQADTIVFKAWGSGQPSILYGTDASNSQPGSLGPLGDGNALPWEASTPYSPGALYYAVTAQLEGSGAVSDSVTEVVVTTCAGQAPRTESFPLASGSASGGYAIARAEYVNEGGTGNAGQAESDAGC